MDNFNGKSTPITSDYQTCNECYAVLFVFLNNTHVSAMAEFDQFYKTDDDKTMFLSSKNVLASKDLREHIDWLAKKISLSNIDLNKLKNTYGIKFELKCFWNSKYGHGGPTLWPEQMKTVSDLGIDLTFDIYYQ
jgi:hypothetical protein